MKKIFVVVAIIAAIVGGRLVFLAQTSAPEVKQAPIPIISIDQILTATDLVAGVKQAVKNKDEQLFAQWMEQAYQVGVAGQLSEDDLAYLKSNQCADYLRFNAKRSLFNDEFELRYKALLPIDDLVAKYPEAADLISQADALLLKRDSLIEQMAQTLAGSEPVQTSHIERARQMWLEKYTASEGGWCHNLVDGKFFFRPIHFELAAFGILVILKRDSSSRRHSLYR